MKPIRLENVAQFRPGKLLPGLVYGSEGVRVFLLCLEPGQGLSPRRDAEEVLCYLVSGRATLTIGQAAFPLAAGELAGAAAGEGRGIEAQERCVALWIQVSSHGDG